MLGIGFYLPTMHRGATLRGQLKPGLLQPIPLHSKGGVHFLLFQGKRKLHRWPTSKRNSLEIESKIKL